MISLFLLVSLSCPSILMKNTSNDMGWSERDYEDLEKAKIRCGEIYPNNPCVTIFEKYAYQSYRVTCGAQR